MFTLKTFWKYQMSYRKGFFIIVLNVNLYDASKNATCILGPNGCMYTNFITTTKNKT